jgi:hypothetical protein
MTKFYAANNKAYKTYSSIVSEHDGKNIILRKSNSKIYIEIDSPSNKNKMISLNIRRGPSLKELKELIEELTTEYDEEVTTEATESTQEALPIDPKAYEKFMIKLNTAKNEENYSAAFTKYDKKNIKFFKKDSEIFIQIESPSDENKIISVKMKKKPSKKEFEKFFKELIEMYDAYLELKKADEQSSLSNDKETAIR